MDNQTTTTQLTGAADASLVAMAKAGDEAAMDQLVGKYWTIAYRIAVRIVRSHEDAEEVAQDAVWAAITHLPTFREDACFSTWLHRIAVNHSLMALRRKHARRLDSLRLLSIDSPAAFIEGPPTPEELLLETEYGTAVEEGLSRVPSHYSVALRLASREERSLKEIAEYMGISVPVVKTRLHRGRAYLRRQVLPRLCVKNARTPESRRALQPYRRTGEWTVAA
jgi:RNA polymerase sigma-70 factor (ECF subfamily)